MGNHAAFTLAEVGGRRRAPEDLTLLILTQ